MANTSDVVNEKIK